VILKAFKQMCIRLKCFDGQNFDLGKSPMLWEILKGDKIVPEANIWNVLAVKVTVV
jgi:hypothetical protein